MESLGECTLSHWKSEWNTIKCFSSLYTIEFQRILWSLDKVLEVKKSVENSSHGFISMQVEKQEAFACYVSHVLVFWNHGSLQRRYLGALSSCRPCKEILAP
jgi:hypothetical protein